MFKKALILGLTISGHIASATTMSCLVGVYKASDLQDTEGFQKTTKRLKVEIDPVEESGKLADAEVNGQKVYFSVGKHDFVDVYTLDIYLTTPVKDRIPRSSVVGGFSEFIENNGPARDDGWNPDFTENTTDYKFMNRQSGTIALMPKLKDALFKGGLWGKHPFTETSIEMAYVSNLVTAVKELRQKNILAPNDVIALSTLYSCNKEGG